MTLCAVAWGAAAAAVANAGISAAVHSDSDVMRSNPCGVRAGWANVATIAAGGEGAGVRLTFGPTPTFDLPPPGSAAASTPRADPTTLYTVTADPPMQGEALWARRSGLVVVGRRLSRPAWVWRPTWAPPVPAAMQPYPFAVPAPVAAELWQRMGLDPGPRPSDPRAENAKGWPAPIATLLWLLVAVTGFISAGTAWRAVRKRRGV